MPRIRCHYSDCVFLDDGYCSAALAEIDPDQGCLTYSPTAEAAADDSWDDDEDEMDEWEEGDEGGDDDDDIWGDEDDESY